MVKVVEGEDLSIADFAFSDTQMKAIAELQAAFDGLDAALANIKRAKLSFAEGEGGSFVSSREDHLSLYTEGSVFGASISASLLAHSIQGLAVRCARGEPGVMRISRKKRVEAPLELIVDKGNRGGQWIPGDIALGQGDDVSRIPEIAKEVARRKTLNMRHHPWLRGNVVVFQDNPFRQG